MAYECDELIKIKERVIRKITAEIEKRNRENALDEYLTRIGCGSCIQKYNDTYQRNAKILILGALVINKSTVKSIAGNIG